MYSVASLHARFHGNVLMPIDSFKPGGPSPVYRFQPRGYREAVKTFRVVCSDASMHKHRKIYDELLTISRCPADPRHRYCIILIERTVEQLCSELEGLDTDAAINRFVYIVTKSEVAAAKDAFASAVRKAPTAIGNVKTFSEFVECLGVCDKPTSALKHILGGCCHTRRLHGRSCLFPSHRDSDARAIGARLASSI